MQYRRLGRTDITVSAVAMGCWAIVGDSTWGPQDERDSIAAIHAALDEGINFFDTAEMYGDGYSEQLLGRALADRREEAVIVSKVSPNHLEPNALKEACESSLRRLRTDYLDLYLIHWPNWDIPVERSLGAMAELKRQGKIRAAGVSNFGRQDLTELLQKGRAEANQLPYSLLFRAVEFEIQQVCADNDISILCYCPLAQGLLTGKFASPDEVPEGRARTRLFSRDRPQSRHSEPGAEKETFEAIERIRDISEELGTAMADVALAWLLHQPAVTAVVAGARNADQVRMNARAGELELSQEMLERLAEATESLKARLGRNPDMWQTEPRMR